MLVWLHIAVATLVPAAKPLGRQITPSTVQTDNILKLRFSATLDRSPEGASEVRALRSHQDTNRHGLPFSTTTDDWLDAAAEWRLELLPPTAPVGVESKTT